MSVFSKTGTANRLTFDELGSSSWKNKPDVASPSPAEGSLASTTPATDAVWLSNGRQVVTTRDGMTATISFLPGVGASGDIIEADKYFAKVNDRWDDDPSSPTYNLICVSVKEAPYGTTSNGSERCMYTAEFSTQPLDPTEIDFGGDFISCKGSADRPSGFKWADDNSAVAQTLHKITLSVKFRVTKRRTSLPYNIIRDRLGCVNSDDVSIPNNRGGVAAVIAGTQDEEEPDHAFLLFEGCKAVETTDPKGGVMWKIVYNFTAKYNWDSIVTTPTGWNNIYKDATGKFELVYTGEVGAPTYLYREMDLSVLIADERET